MTYFSSLRLGTLRLRTLTRAVGSSAPRKPLIMTAPTINALLQGALTAGFLAVRQVPPGAT